MEIDIIVEIGIDKYDRLYLKPEKVKFPLIYRTASEVHWDNNHHFLFSPKPKDWDYLKWYKHIMKVTQECNCMLKLTAETKWVNISEELKLEIKK